MKKVWTQNEGEAWLRVRDFLLDEKFSGRALSTQDEKLLELLQEKVAEAFPRVTEEDFAWLGRVEARVAKAGRLVDEHERKFDEIWGEKDASETVAHEHGAADEGGTDDHGHR